MEEKLTQYQAVRIANYNPHGKVDFEILQNEYERETGNTISRSALRIYNRIGNAIINSHNGYYPNLICPIQINQDLRTPVSVLERPYCPIHILF